MNIPKLNNKINIGQSIIRLPKLTDIFPCFLLFLAGRASVIGMFPFGIAMFCAAFQKSISYIGIITLVLAGISVHAGIWTYKYVLGAILFWLYSRIREDYRNNSLLSSFVSGACLFFGGLVLTLYYPTGMYDFLVVCIESVLCAFFYIVFDKASLLFTYSREGCGEAELVSGALCLGILITGVSDIILPFNISLSSLITIYAVMCIAMHENLAVSGAGGLAAGFMCSMSNTAAITLMGFYGLCAIASNLLKGFKKFGIVLGFLGGSAITLFYIGNSFEIPLSIFEVLISVLLFILTPDSVHKKIGVFFKRTLHPEIVPETVRMREYLSDRLCNASDVFLKLKDTIKSATDRRLNLYNKDMCSIFDEVTDRVCRKCSTCGKCFGENQNNSFRIIFSLLEVIESQGFCNEYNAPSEFLNLCEKPEVFLNEFSHVYEIYKTEILKLGNDKNNRDLLLQQYGEISDLFFEMSEEIKGGFCFLTETEKRIADELSASKINVKEVKVIESLERTLDIYIACEKNISQKLLEEKLSNILKVPVSFIENCGNYMMKFAPKGLFFTEVYTKQIPKEGQLINGDNLVCFSDKNYKYYVILCDGMGSGEKANRESKICADMIMAYLKAGFSPKMTLNIVNSAISLKSDNEIFSSIDLLCIDLMSGQADFYKIGASKSFFCHSGRTETIFSDTLPSGIFPENHINITSKRISDGDILIMMSDGVSDSSPGYLSGERISKIVEKDAEDIKGISEMILSSALKKKYNKAIDDMTVATIKINLNE